MSCFLYFCSLCEYVVEIKNVLDCFPLSISEMLQMIYQCVYAAVCWGGGVTQQDAKLL